MCGQEARGADADADGDAGGIPAETGRGGNDAGNERARAVESVEHPGCGVTRTCGLSCMGVAVWAGARGVWWWHCRHGASTSSKCMLGLWTCIKHKYLTYVLLCRTYPLLCIHALAAELHLCSRTFLERFQPHIVSQGPGYERTENWMPSWLGHVAGCARFVWELGCKVTW